MYQLGCRNVGAERSLEASVGRPHTQRSASLGDSETQRPPGMRTVGHDVGESGDGESKGDHDHRGDDRRGDDRRGDDRRGDPSVAGPSVAGPSVAGPGAENLSVVEEKPDAQHDRSADKGDGPDQQQPSTEGDERGERSVGLTEIDATERKATERPETPQGVGDHDRGRHRADERQRSLAARPWDGQGDDEGGDDHLDAADDQSAGK